MPVPVRRRRAPVMPDHVAIRSPGIGMAGSLSITVRVALPFPGIATVIIALTRAKQRHQHEQTSSNSREHVQVQHSMDCPPPRSLLSTSRRGASGFPCVGAIASSGLPRPGWVAELGLGRAKIGSGLAGVQFCICKIGPTPAWCRFSLCNIDPTPAWCRFSLCNIDPTPAWCRFSPLPGRCRPKKVSQHEKRWVGSLAKRKPRPILQSFPFGDQGVSPCR